MGIVGDGLERAEQQAFTRPIPKSTGAQVRYLVRQHRGSTKAVASLLGRAPIIGAPSCERPYGTVQTTQAVALWVTSEVVFTTPTVQPPTVG